MSEVFKYQHFVSIGYLIAWLNQHGTHIKIHAITPVLEDSFAFLLIYTDAF